MKDREGNRFHSLLPSAGLLIALALIVGCATGTWGRLDMSSEVRRDFMEGKVLPAHRYYTSGGENTPIAIIGISEEFTLVTERWREREMTPELLRKLVYSMSEEYGSVEAGLVGSTIVDQKGGPIGVWYAPVPTSTVKILGEKEIEVYPPVLKDMDRLPLLRRR